MRMMDLFLEGADIIKQAILQYKGSGYLLELFLVMLVLLLFLSKRNSFERKIAYYTILSMIVLCNPFVAVILKKVALETVYWRTLWILPMGIVSITALIIIVKKMKNNWMKIFTSICFCVVIVKCGGAVLTEDNFHKSENCYKIPEEAVETANIILKDAGGTAKVIAPEEISTWVREYSADIIVPYGRGYIYGYEGWKAEIEYQRDAWRSDPIDVNKIDEIVKVWDYDYLVMDKRKAEADTIEVLGYELLGTTNEYNIFKYIRGEV